MTKISKMKFKKYKCLYISFYWEPDENLIENRTIILTWYFFEGIQRNYFQNLI
jgi:hypothetical protein